jgi:hypothetical protein
MSGEPAVPLGVRLRFGRAAVQTLADRAGIRLLHIKGESVAPGLRPHGGIGSDVDVLIDPARLEALNAELEAHGWALYSTFEWGSPFGHAQTYQHPMWGFLDVHRFFPGIGLAPSAAFEELWSERSAMTFAGVDCPVPDLDAQAVILLLNAARAGRAANSDVSHLWEQASDTEQDRRLQRVDALEARLAFDAAIGRLDRHRGERDYLLWKTVSRGGSRIQEWWGRVLAAPTPRARLRIIMKAPLVNTEHLGRRLGHAPNRGELVGEFFARPLRGMHELAQKRGRS